MEKFIVEPLKMEKAKYIVIFWKVSTGIHLDECNTIDEVNELVKFHQNNSVAFEVYEI
jgi:hypothetical protein